MTAELPSLAFDSARYAASQTELHAIYNRHVAKKDAKRTLENIPPDSIVYMEGLRLETLPEHDLRLVAADLGRYARVYGKDKEYRNSRDTIAKVLGNDNYESYLYSTLIKKDCQIVNADYRHVSDPDNQSDFDIVTGYISDWHKTEINVGKGLGISNNEKQYFVDLADLIQQRWQSVEVREESATDIIVHDLADLALYQHLDGVVPRSETGKMQAYLIYGASHKYSLTKRLVDAGIDVVPTDVSGSNGDIYIHEPYEQFQNNFMRTLAFTAFKAATWKMAHLYKNKDGDDAPMAGMHEALAILNGDEEATIDFCSRCLKIQKSAGKHPKKSLKDYWKLVDTYTTA